MKYNVVVSFAAGLLAREFRLFLDFVFLTPIAKLSAKYYHRLKLRYPLHFQPFRHYKYHGGHIDDCDQGMCKLI